MTRPAGPPRVVIDTNLVLSALVFEQGRLAQLRHASSPSFPAPPRPIRVLAYPKFKLSPEEQRELLADYLPYCKTVRSPSRCRRRRPAATPSTCLSCNWRWPARPRRW